jgi:hypothetical protein
MKDLRLTGTLGMGKRNSDDIQHVLQGTLETENRTKSSDLDPRTLIPHFALHQVLGLKTDAEKKMIAE